MAPFTIFSDTSCDLPSELTARYDIRLVPYYISFNGVKYFREGVDMSCQEFYDSMRKQKVFPKTSFPSVSDYTESFLPALESGRDVLCLCLSSKFSGSFQCATIVSENLREEFPQRQVTVIDTTQASVGQGQLVLLAAKLREAGKSLAETRDALERAKQTSKIYLTVDSLEYLQRGGRIGKVSAFAGALFGIKPVIAMEYGELSPRSKVRGRKKALLETVELALGDIGAAPGDYSVAVMHSDCRGEALEFKAMLNEAYNLNIELPLFELGMTIGAHIGPTVLGLAYTKKQPGAEY